MCNYFGKTADTCYGRDLFSIELLIFSYNQSPNEKSMKNKLTLGLLLVASATCHTVLAQKDSATVNSHIAELEKQIKTLQYTELVQSMSQRSLLTPSYFYQLKALVARQAYNFWTENDSETYVSHLNIYSSLYYANKYLGYDSVNQVAYNQALGHNESVVSIQFGVDPNVFYSAGSDGKVLKWEVNNLKGVPEVIYEGNHLIRSIDISDDNKWIMVVTKNQGIMLVKIDGSGIEQETPLVHDPEIARTAIFLPNQPKYLMVNRQGELKIKGYGENKRVAESTSKIRSLAVDPETDDIFAGTEEGTVKVWSDTLERDLYFKESYAINTMAISSDHKKLAMGREKGDVILWDLKAKELIRIISGHQSAITDVDFTPDNKTLLSASRDGTVRLWDVNDPKKFPILLDDHEDWVLTACFDPSGNYVISGSKDNYIRMWPVQPAALAGRICDLVDRNLTKEEWSEYVGTDVPYQKTCPN